MARVRSPFPESKLPDTGTSIFSIMSSLAAECGAINLSQGFPDFNCDPELRREVAAAMEAGMNQYAPSPGLPALRQAIAADIAGRYGRTLNPEREITVTSGATEALYAAITAVVREGDEVILFEPAYDSYDPAIRLNGGTPVYISLNYPDYDVPWDQVKRMINRKTRLIILNTPHNPTGAVLNAADITELNHILEGHDFYLLSDEVYEHILFDGKRHESMNRYPAIAARSFIVSSFGKSFHTTGWKVGYCVAPAHLTTELRKVHQFLTFSTSTPFQAGMATYMEGGDRYSGLGAFYQAKRDFFRKAVEGSRFKVLNCHGTYFQCLSYADISEEPDTVFAERITREFGVASIPVSVFYHSNEDHRVLRFCFAKSEETLSKAGEILRRI